MFQAPALGIDLYTFALGVSLFVESWQVPTLFLNGVEYATLWAGQSQFSIPYSELIPGAEYVVSYSVDGEASAASSIKAWSVPGASSFEQTPGHHGEGSVRMTARRSSDHGGDFAATPPRIVIEHSADGGATWQTIAESANETHYIDQTFAAGEHRFRCLTVNPIGEGPRTDAVSVTVE